MCAKKKKIPLFHVKRENTHTQHKKKAKKKEKRHKTNRRTTDFFFFFLRRGNTLHTHFGGFIIHSFARGKAEFSCSSSSSSFEKRSELLFPEEEEEEEILETINKHRVVSFELLRDSNTNKRIKEDCAGGFDSIVRIHGQAP